jgi:hypothetical protein
MKSVQSLLLMLATLGVMAPAEAAISKPRIQSGHFAIQVGPRDSGKGQEQDVSQKLEGVGGFACKLDDGVAVIGLRAGGEGTVSAGDLTEKRVAALQARLHTSFVAFSMNGRYYVVTDQTLVNKALSFYSMTMATYSPLPEASGANARHSEQRAGEAARLGQSLAAFPVESMGDSREVHTKLQTLLSEARHQGKAVRISL